MAILLAGPARRLQQTTPIILEEVSIRRILERRNAINDKAKRYGEVVFKFEKILEECSQKLVKRLESLVERHGHVAEAKAKSEELLLMLKGRNAFEIAACDQKLLQTIPGDLIAMVIRKTLQSKSPFDIRTLATELSYLSEMYVLLCNGRHQEFMDYYNIGLPKKAKENSRKVNAAANLLKNTALDTLVAYWLPDALKD